MSAPVAVSRHRRSSVNQSHRSEASNASDNGASATPRYRQSSGRAAHQSSTPREPVGGEESSAEAAGNATEQAPAAQSSEASASEAGAEGGNASGAENAENGKSAESKTGTAESDTAGATRGESSESEEETAQGEGGEAQEKQGSDADATEEAQGPARRESRRAPAGRSRQGLAFLPPKPVVRLGIRAPLVHAPPKPSIERREEISQRTGMPPELHHAQIQDALNRTTQGARDAQRGMAREVEALAENTRLSAVEMAEEIPSVVAACIGAINRAVDETKEAVTDAGTQYHNHILEHGVLVGEALKRNRNETTAQIFSDLQDGADHIDEANQVVQSHFDANLLEAADKIESLPDAGTYVPLEGPEDSSEASEGGAGGQSGAELQSSWSEDPEDRQAKTIAGAETILSDWLPEGADAYANRKHAQLPGLVNYFVDRTSPYVSEFLAPTDERVRDGQVERFNALNSDSTRSQFAIMALGLTAPVATTHRQDRNDTEDTAEAQEEDNEAAVLSGVERAQQRMEQTMLGVNERLENTTRPKLQRNVRQAGQRIQRGLYEQSHAAESALLGAAARMADAYRDLVERLKGMLTEGRFLDARDLMPRIQAALDSARSLRASHVDAAGEQAAGTIDQLGEAQDQQVDSLWELTGKSTDSLNDVISQTRFDFMLYAEQMTGEFTDGRDQVVDQAAQYADKMARNILRMAERNDNEAIPRLESLSVNFLNGRIQAAQDWQYQVIDGRVMGLKSPDGQIVQLWKQMLTDLNERSQQLDGAMPDAGASAEGAAASAVAGGALYGPLAPLGAGIGVGVYLATKSVDEDELLEALGDLPQGGGEALKDVFGHNKMVDSSGNVQTVERGELVPRIEDTVDSPDRERALTLLSGTDEERAQVKIDIAQESTEWFGYSREARESALQGLTDEERATLSPEEVADLSEALENDLDGTEETISQAYLEGNRELALAARIEEELESAREDSLFGAATVRAAEREADQAAVEAATKIETLARDELAFEHAHISPERLREFTGDAFEAYADKYMPDEQKPPGGFSNEEGREAAREFVIEQFTDIERRVHQPGHRGYGSYGGGYGAGYGGPGRVSRSASVSGEAEEVIRDTLTHGANSEEAQQSRAVYEIQRARDGSGLSETTQTQLTQALENPRLSELKARIRHSSDPEERARLEQQLVEVEREHQQRMQQVAERLGAPASELETPAAATDWLADEVGELFAREGGEHARYGREMIKNGRPSMISAIDLATDGAGTHEDLLLHAYKGRTQEEIDAVQDQWAEAHNGEDLNVMLGIEEREWDAYDTASLVLGPAAFLAQSAYRGGETSGDVAMELQRLADGPVKSDLDAVNRAGLKVDQQERGTGFLAGLWMPATTEGQIMEQRRQNLGRQVVEAAAERGEDVSYFRDNPDEIFGRNGRLNSRLQQMAFDEEGNFHGNELALRGQTQFTDLAADNYQAEIDRQESILTTTLTVLTIAVSIALMLIPGVNVVAAGIISALVGGALTMTAKQGMRGERYGWEEAATDMAQTGIEAATAGAAGALAGGLGKAGALAKIGSAMDDSLGKVGGAVTREAITGAISNAAQTGIQDDTFKDGTEQGFERLFNSALKGAAMGAVTAGVSEGVSKGVSRKLNDSLEDSVSRSLRQGDEALDTPTGRAARLLGPSGREVFTEGVSELAGGSLGEGAGILVDYANGEFKGSFGDALKQMGQAGLRDMISGMGRAGAQARNQQRYRQLLDAARQQGGELSPREARALRLAGISAGAMDYSTPLSAVRETVRVESGLRSQLPESLKNWADTASKSNLEALVRGLEAGDFGGSREKLALVQKLAGELPAGDSRQVLAQLNRALRQSTEARADRQAEEAARRERQKRTRNQLLTGVPGPTRAHLARLPVDQLDGLSPTALREASALIADGRYDPARARALLNQAGDLDAVGMMHNLQRLTDTSGRAQAALRAREQNLRAELAAGLTAEGRQWLGERSPAEIQHLHTLLQNSVNTGVVRAGRADTAPPELSRTQWNELFGAHAGRTLDASRAGEEPALRRELLRYVPSEQRVRLAETPIVRVGDAEFTALTRSRSGQAVTLIVDGQPRIVVRASADPRVLREEGVHLLQSRDPEWAERVGALDERKLADWDNLPLREQMALYRNKLALEVDAQQRLLRNVRAELDAAGTGRERMALTEDLELAQRTLDNLRRRQEEVGRYDGKHLRGIELGLFSRPQWLDQPARLFMKGKKSEAETRAPPADSAEAQAMARLESKLDDAPEILGRVKAGLEALPDSLRPKVADKVASMRNREHMPVLAERLANIHKRLQSDELSATLFRLAADIDDLDNRQRLLDSAEALSNQLTELGVAREQSAEMLSRLVDLSQEVHQRFEFMESAAELARLIAMDGSSAASKQLVQHLTEVLTGRDVPAAEGAAGSWSATKAQQDLAADIQKVPALMASDSPTVLMKAMADNLANQGNLAGGDTLSLRLELAQSRWAGFVRENPEFARLLEEATPHLDEAQRALLVDVQPWFSSVVQSDWFRTEYLQRRGIDLETAKANLLRDLLTEADLGVERMSDRSADALRRRLESAARDMVAMTETTEFVRGRSGQLIDQETDSFALIREEMKALGFDDAEITRRFENLEKHWRKARAEGTVTPEDHIYNLVRQREKYQAMIETAEQIADQYARELGADITEAQRNRLRREKLAELTQGLRQRVTEVSGELAATGELMRRAGEEGGYELVRGFEAGTGFDQVWRKRTPDGGVELVVVEAKGLGAGLSDSSRKGPQMSPQWVARTIGEMLLRSDDPLTARELYEAIHNGSDKVKIRGVVVTATEEGLPEMRPAPDTMDDKGTYSLEQLRHFIRSGY